VLLDHHQNLAAHEDEDLNEDEIERSASNPFKGKRNLKAGSTIVS
jgi:hypothetical protein